MADFIPTTALVLSVAGLGLSILNYLRDRSKIEVWSDVLYHRKGDTPDSLTPMLRIRVANLGRRPAVILNLVKESGTQRWSQPLKEPNFPEDKSLNIAEVTKLLENHSLAQNSAIRLMEGDVVDFCFWPEDCPRFIATHVDDEEMPHADKLFVEDCAGDLHKVRDSDKNLKTLFGAWNP